MKLRPYQSDAIAALRDRLRAGKRRVVLVSATGSGKTVISAAMINSAVSLGKRCMFLAHRKELIEQCSTRLDDIGVDHGIIKAKHWRRIPEAPVQVASVQTLLRRELPPADLIFADECHLSLSPTFRKIFDAYPRAAIIGLTATPWRLDGQGLGDIYDDMVVVAQSSELIADGFIMEPRLYAPQSVDLSSVHTQRGDYVASELDALYADRIITGGIVDHWQKLAGGTRTLVFCCSIKHAQTVAHAFSDAGVACGHINGEMADKERTATLGALRSGELRVVTNVGICTTGYDLPSLGCVVLARPTQSSVLYLQMVGRALRPLAGKAAPIILDHANCFAQHGWPTADREYVLEETRESSERKSQDQPATHRVCPSCFEVVPMDPVCPECGHYEERIRVAEVSGELEEVAAAGEYDVQCSTCKKKCEIIWSQPTHPRYKICCHSCGLDDWRTRVLLNAPWEVKKSEYDRLEEIREQRGYAPGWTAHRYKAVFGVWPRKMQT